MKFAPCLLSSLLLPAVTHAATSTEEAYPTMPVRMLVISSAAGSTDIIARMTAKALSEGLRQQVVLDNRPGGGGLIA